MVESVRQYKRDSKRVNQVFLEVKCPWRLKEEKFMIPFLGEISKTETNCGQMGERNEIFFTNCNWQLWVMILKENLLDLGHFRHYKECVKMLLNPHSDWPTS